MNALTTAGIPPTTAYSRKSEWKRSFTASGTRSRRSKHLLTKASESSEYPLAARYSANDSECMTTCRSKPTGTERGTFLSRSFLCLMPSSEPDAMTSNVPSRASGLNAVRAFGQSCISSRNSSVRPGTMRTFVRMAVNRSQIDLTSSEPSKMSMHCGSRAKLISMKLS